MSKDYVQQPGSNSDVRVDGKRVAGKLRFNPPGSGGSRPEMAERDMEFIPELQGGNEAQPAGAHSHDKYRTCLLYTSPSPRDRTRYSMPSSA